MFQVSAKTDYGLLIMTTLAANPGRYVPLSPLASHLQVSSPYLSQVAKSLQRAALLVSKEGKNGGYALARPAADISVLAVIEALSGELRDRCRSGARPCPHHGNCELRGYWPFIISDMRSALAGRSLASLCAKK